MGICSHRYLRKEGTHDGQLKTCFDWEVPHTQRKFIMSPESQKSSLGVISDIATFAIAINPSVLLKFFGPEKI